MNELIITDGLLPEKEIVDQWLKIVDEFFDPNADDAKKEDDDT